jgi:hypothetical protein
MDNASSSLSSYTFGGQSSHNPSPTQSRPVSYARPSSLTASPYLSPTSDVQFHHQGGGHEADYWQLEPH